jgi:Leucine-rich repeat (LRR) protein
MRVAESQTTSISAILKSAAMQQESFPLDILIRCHKVRLVVTAGQNVTSLASLTGCTTALEDLMIFYGEEIESLEGTPSQMKVLYVGLGRSLKSLVGLEACLSLGSLVLKCQSSISDLTPLAACTMLTTLEIPNSYITDISVLSKMPMLEKVVLGKEVSRLSIKDLSPLSRCLRLRCLDVSGNRDIEDLTPLVPLSCLEVLFVNYCNIIDLSLLTNLPRLNHLFCKGLPDSTSFLPLAVVANLHHLICSLSRLQHPEIEELENSRLHLSFVLAVLGVS